MTSRTHSNTTIAAALLLAAAGLLASSGPVSAAPTPAGRTYFVVALGLSPATADGYQTQATCLEFTANDVCQMDGDCGSWWQLSEKPRKRSQSLFGYRFDVIDDTSGLPITIRGTGRLDASGAKRSIGLVGHAVEPVTQTLLNFSLAGHTVRASRCERLLADYTAQAAERRSR